MVCRPSPFDHIDFARRFDLLDRAIARSDKSLINVSAPWGYGKTTLLKAWQAARGSAENRIYYIDIASLHCTRIEHPGGDNIAAVLLPHIDNALNDGGIGILILDHYPADYPALDTLLLDIVKSPDAGLHLIVASRAPLARSAHSGEVYSIGTQELALSPDEMQTACTAVGLRAGGLQHIIDGWPWAVGMAQDWAQSGLDRNCAVDSQDFLDVITCENRKYAPQITHNLLGDLPEADVELLTITSFLSLLDPDLVAAVTSSDTNWRNLDHLRQIGLLEPNRGAGKEAGLRCHSVIKAILFKRLQLRGERLLRRLHIRAALHFMRRGALKAALCHACAGYDSALAVRIFLKAGGVAIGIRDGLAELQANVDLLPSDALGNARVGVAVAAVMLKDGRGDVGMEMLRNIGAQARASGGDSDPLLLRDILLVEMIAIHFGDSSLGSAESRYDSFVSHSPAAEHAIIHGAIYNSKCLAAFRAGQFKHALVCAETASYFYQTAQVSNGLMHMCLHSARILRAQGDVARARDDLQAARQILIEQENPNLSNLAHADVQLAAIQAEQGDFLSAAPCCAIALPRIKASEPLWEALYEGYSILSAARAFAMDPAEALNELQAGLAFARRNSMPELESMLRLQLLQNAIHSGTMGIGPIIAEFENIAQIPHWLVRHARSLVHAHILALSDRLEDGLLVLCDAEEEYRAANMARSLTECALERVMMFERAGRRTEAVAALRQALALAEPTKIILPFIQRRDFIHSILIQSQVETSHASRRSGDISFGADVLGRLFAQDEGRSTSLSSRERAIMCDLASGCSNKEIARKLHVSPETIRFHLKNVYAKLGVNAGRGNRQIVADFARQHMA